MPKKTLRTKILELPRKWRTPEEIAGILECEAQSVRQNLRRLKEEKLFVRNKQQPRKRDAIAFPKRKWIRVAE